MEMYLILLLLMMMRTSYNLIVITVLSEISTAKLNSHENVPILVHRKKLTLNAFLFVGTLTCRNLLSSEFELKTFLLNAISISLTQYSSPQILPAFISTSDI